MDDQPLRPDEVIGPDGQRWPALRSRLKEAALVLPHFVKLLGRLMRDPRVPPRSKAFAGAALVYVASPVDLLPDVIPVLGSADDLIVAVFAVHHLLRTAGEEVVVEHWDGSRDVLEIVDSLIGFAAQLIPARTRWFLTRILGR